MAKKNLTLVEKAEKQIEEKIKVASGCFLPSMAFMAQEFGVSLWVISKAAKNLKNKRIIDYSKGRRIQVTGKSVNKPVIPIPENKKTSAEIFAEQIETQIKKGVFRSGFTMPKMAVISKKEKISTVTVLKAFKILQNQNLVHKQARSWIVGSRQLLNLKSQQSFKKRATILILLSDASAWRNMKNNRSRSFIESFLGEVKKFGINVVSGFVSKNQRVPPGANLVGINEIRKLIHSLGDQYLGSLAILRSKVTSNPWSSIHSLLEYKKPVVWSEPNSDLPHLKGNRFFSRCVLQEMDVANTAVEYMKSLGHKRLAAWSDRKNPNGWKHQRFEYLLKACHKYKVELIDLEFPFESKTKSKTKTEPETKTEIQQIKNPFNLPDWADSIVKQINLYKNNVSGFFVPRDYTSFHIYNGMVKAGIRIPEDVSILSFDNNLLIQMLPLDSVDFGFDYLGYAAFHTIFGDLSFRTAKGEIFAIPKVIERGSVRQIFN